jgi:hypothetical protein
MEWSPISETEIAIVLKTTLHWKAPGRDQIANFVLSNLQQHPHVYLNKLIEEEQIPARLMAGVTILVPKNENTEKPMSYRPVTPYAYSIQNHYIISKLMQKVY